MATQAYRRKFFEIFVVILLLLAAFLIILLIGGFKPPVTSHKVTFEVNASGGYALITLKTPQDSILSGTIVTTPWRKSMTLPRGSEVYLTAANPSQTGALSCSISLEEREWKSIKKIAPENGIACAGIVP